ncbi:hypothetical protein SAMN05216298_2125 [Glycomyces sambucus]|uniref:Uncharacterized protein n=1 Tax=Glycomyces sambucus TaxID=380244 RepID=A0A1G9FZH2_9ACTN|nr:hypothetical protein [Glycomyces sambucus]SDK93804.1 hypothetical protein SAMN05216298_2125 [Glycomyces sambucus]
MIPLRRFLMRASATGALLVVLAASGCGSEAEPDAELSASDAAAAASTSGAATPSERPSPEAETEAEEQDEAADSDAGGGACDDGDCETSFSGSVAFPLGGEGQWTVEAVVQDGGVQISLTNPDGLGGGGGFLDHPSCALLFRSDGSGSLTCDEEPEAPDSGGIMVELVAHDGDDATVGATLG